MVKEPKEHTPSTAGGLDPEVIGATAAKRILAKNIAGGRMREFKADKYRRLVEHSENPLLRKYQPAEEGFLEATPDASNRTFVDLGAGHGRVVPVLANIGENVIAIELNPDMFEGPEGLGAVSKQFPNVIAVKGNILDLEELIQDQKISRPVFLILQNSLGTIEGAYTDVLDTIARVGSSYSDSELILSLLRAQALGTQGLEMYAGLKDMVGEVDLEKTDSENGLFVSKTGYTSKWWTNEEIADFKRLGRVAEESIEPEFVLLRIELNR